jgi:LysM repeat protein
MGILDAVSDIGGATLSNLAAPFKTIFGSIPDYVGSDFDDGFTIEEITPEDSTALGVTIELVGEWLPHQPFTYGGKQQLVKEYYPGNAEPTVQVMGAREDNVTIKGTFKVKHISEPTLREVPQALCDAIDDIRQRGNLFHISLGEWERWGFIEQTKFDVKTLARIDYEITFSIMGDSPPSECKLQESAFTVPGDTNLALISAAVDFEDQFNQFAPTGMSLGLFDTLNNLVGKVATALSVVTKFVDGVLSVATNTEQIANHAIGLIKYAQAQISQYKKQVGQLNAYFGSDPTAGTGLKTWNEPANAKQAAFVSKCQLATSKPALPSAAQVAATPNTQSTVDKYAASIKTQTNALNKSPGQSIDALLATMLKQMQQVANALPKARYVIKQGDTLQKISMHFYGNPDHWEAIMKFNKLETTVLVPGTVIGIPKQ